LICLDGKEDKKANEVGVSALNLNQLYYLCAIHKYGSISQAAREILVSQPTLTVAVHELETEFDIRLMERSNKGVRFTEAGNLMVENAKRILMMVDDLKVKMHDLSEDTKELRVGLTSAMSKQIVPLMLQPIEQFEATHPKLRIKLMERTYNGQFDDLEKSITRLAFGKSLKKLDPTLAFVPLLLKEVMLCVGPSHPLAGQETVSIEDFKNENLLTNLMLDSKTNIAISDWLKKSGYVIPFQYYSQSSVVEELILMGRGVSLSVPRVYISNDQLICIPIENSVSFEYGVFYRKSKKLNPEEKAFIQMMKIVLNED